MSNSPTRILLIEDDFDDADLLCELLELVPQSSFQVSQSVRLSEALLHLSQERFDVVLLDLSLPDSQGLATVKSVYSQMPTVPIIVLSGLEDESVAIKAVHEGAQDYLVKGKFDGDSLVRAIRYAIERTKVLQLLYQREQQLQQANQHLLRLEDDLREALAQEKELNELKSRIITTISHEYRTPLMTIASSAGLLESYRHRWDDNKQLVHFQRIQTAVNHLTDLVEDVLFLNKAEFEKTLFNPTVLDLLPFFQELIAELQSIADERHNVIFTPLCDCVEATSISAQLDAKLLRQIFTNLVSNAIKYSPFGSTVQVRLTCEDNKVIFQVQDEGIGIPIEDQPHLFKSFSRASNVGTIPGSGLGLSIVKKCVDLHNGQIAVDSEVGVGTTFTITLPYMANVLDTVEYIS